MAKFKVTIEKIKFFEAEIEIDAINSFEAIKAALSSNLDFKFINEMLGDSTTAKIVKGE